MNTVHGFNQKRDVQRTLRMLDKWEASQAKTSHSKNFVRQEARYARITSVIDAGDPDTKDKEAFGVAVKWDAATFNWVDITENPTTYDNDAYISASATMFAAKNISSKSVMAVNDIVFLQYYPALSDTSDWLVVETGGGGRAYVVITAVTDAANYVGDVITGPDDPTIITVGVAIKVKNATSNEFNIGYDDFADVIGEIYWLDGDVLG